MPRVSPDQFKDFRFTVGRTDAGEPAVAVEYVVPFEYGDEGTYRHPDSEVTGRLSSTPPAVGSLVIDNTTRAEKDEEQDYINTFGWGHSVEEEPVRSSTGKVLGQQRRWADGNMDPAPDYVRWLGLDSNVASKNSAVLRAMMGLAVQEHGSIPQADPKLTDQGSRISRHMSGSAGVKGHHSNPTMDANVGRMGDEDVEWNARNNLSDMVNTGKHRVATNVEAAQAVEQVNAHMRETRNKKRGAVPKAPRQDSLPGI